MAWGTAVLTPLLDLLSYLVNSLKNQCFKLLALNTAAKTLKQFPACQSLLFLLFFWKC